MWPQWLRAGTRLCRSILMIGLPTALLLLGSAAHAAPAARVLIVATSPVAPGKFVKLAALGEAAGVRLESVFAEKIASDVGPEWFKAYDLVLFDTPRDHLEEFVRTRLAKSLAGLKTPALWLHDSRPNWQGLPEAEARRWHAYYVNGGRPNFTALFADLAATWTGKGWAERAAAQIVAPVVFPKTGIYHPRYVGQVFADTASYLRWLAAQPGGGPGGRPGSKPVIAIAMHQQYLSAEQTGHIDDMVTRIEAGGAVPLVFYSPVMDADAVAGILRPAGKVLANVLINTQIMLNPEGRKQEFEALGIPVVQAMTYRQGDEAAWQADPHGVALMDIPFYLAQAEYAGVTDIQIVAATRKSDEQVIAIAAQSAAVVNKALRLARLQTRPNADKQVSIFFWNYPPGEKNLSASFMNLPRSLVATLAALKEAGYRTETPGETELTLLLQRLLAPAYRPAGDQRELLALQREGLAERVPVAAYKQWLASLPVKVQEELQARWGEPEKSSMVVHDQGAAWFIVPRLKLGNITLLPQPPRGERWEEQEKALYHSTKAVPSHFYLAAYWWVREQFRADALVHFGTHGSQEWLPGKERGLAASDYPMLAVGDVPVLYPYIVDDVGEAIQAKRRGRAVIISHQTPPFTPAGLHEALTRIHDQLHAWLAQDDGAVKDKIKGEFLAGIVKERIDKDLGWSAARIAGDFPGFIDTVHQHLHELARTAQPLGLHTFGQGPAEQWRLSTVLSMLGKDFWEAVAPVADDADEMLVDDYRQMSASLPYRLLQDYLRDGRLPAKATPKVIAALAQGKAWYAALGAQNEMAALLAGLNGRHIATSYGGDPLKNPDALPTGRNLYGFDPSRVPTSAAWAAGKEALEQLLATHRRQSGRQPQKLTFSLWSVETMRHFGMLEAQALWALGVEPVWDTGGRVIDVKLVDRQQLGRPRVDVVLSATGLYRDHFPNTMKLLAKAVQLAAEADDGAAGANPVAVNSRRIASDLQARGWSAEAARNAGQTRIFSAEAGRYGTGLDDATLATDSWRGKAEGDRKLAQLYLSRMQFAYGPDEKSWGQGGQSSQSSKQAINLYAEHLKGTEGAVLSRTSKLYGMLTTDDPFQYLGGIALAVRHLDGKAPELYIANLRGSGAGKVEGAAQFLANELATRQFHPGYIEGLKKEGYAGTLQVLDALNNFWGWQATAREIVRDDQWQEFADVYVKDKHQLGLKQWFESNNPHALAQSIERMLEAARQGYWQAELQTVAELKARYRELAQRYDVKTANAAFNAYVGYGLAASASAATGRSPQAATNTPPASPEPLPAPPPLRGIKLERVAEAAKPTLPKTFWPFVPLLLCLGGGALRGLSTGRQTGRPA